MNFFKKPFVAIVVCILVVIISTTVSINSKLSNKYGDVIDNFYEGKISNGFVVDSIYGNIVNMYELADEVVIIADNYGVDTRELVSNIARIKDNLSYKNTDISEIYDIYADFYNSLWAVEIELSGIQLSQRHMEYMSSAADQIYNLKLSIEKADYNEGVNTFYKKFDRFPAKFFIEIFDIGYPDYFA